MRPQRPPRGTSWNGPQIPGRLLHDFYKISTVKTFRQDKGGQHVPMARTEEKFSGCIMPLSNEDIQRLPEGTATVNTQKIYSNGEVLNVGQMVRDSWDNQEYTVTNELTHGSVHNLKRYTVEKVGVSVFGR